jgi:hypothetical protein
VYTIYVLSDLLYFSQYFESFLGNFNCLFKYSLGLLPGSQKFRGIVVVIVIFCKF